MLQLQAIDSSRAHAARPVRRTALPMVASVMSAAALLAGCVATAPKMG